MIEAWAGAVAATGQARGMDQDARLDAQFLGHCRQGGADALVLERFEGRQGLAQSGKTRLVLRNEFSLHGGRVILDPLLEIKSGVGREFTEKLDLSLASVQRGFDVIGGILVGVQASAGRRGKRGFKERLMFSLAAF